MTIEALSDIQKAGVSAFAVGGGGAPSVVQVDFGSAPVSSKFVSFTHSGATTGQRVIMVASAVPPSGLSADELEMDSFVCSARVSATNTIDVFIQAMPGAVMGLRNFNYVVG